jgi:RHS repeat-associated protein
LAQSNNITNPTISTATNRFSAGQNYSYDKDGNLTVDAENKRFVYDAENHQTQLFNATNNTQTPDATYAYDGSGKRVKKIFSTETTIFVYDGGGQLVAEYSTQISQTPQVSYLTSDHLGSPRVITDSLGKVIARHDYSAFGDETYTVQRTQGLGYKPDTIRQDYTGYQKDDESGLEFAQARYYNTAHGRFTSVDPLMASANVKNPQTFNRYSYVLNSPYKFSDPLGLKPSTARGERKYNQELADFLDRNMVDASERQRATYQPARSPVVANTSGGHGGNSGGSHGASGGNSQGADPPASPPPATDQNAESLSAPQIVVRSVSLVSRAAKKTPGGTVILENGKPIIEDTVLATGVKPETSSRDSYNLDLKNASSSLRLGETVYIKVELGINETGDQERAVFEGKPTILKGISESILDSPSAEISEDGRNMTVYFGIKAGNDGLRQGKLGNFTLRATASYIDEYDSSTNKLAQPKTVTGGVNVSLTNSTPATSPFRKPANPF